ncbi:glycosyltransferase family 39 protein [Patescibacteria group bacterium]|nr:glycosyltransferase family 39 protein [Patescibacteria group bacterium]
MKNFFQKHFFSPGWLNSWRPYFLLFILIFLVYGRSLFFDLTFFDDNALIADRQEILSNFNNISSIFLTDVFFSEDRSYYRPMLNLSFMLDAMFGPLNYAIFHLSNIIWHFLAVALSFSLLVRLFKRRQLAFVLALIMAIHPALSQAVAWLPGRNDSIVTVFALLSFWFFLNFLNKEKITNFLALSFFFLLALLSKETIILLPLLFITYFLLFRKSWHLPARSLYLSLLGSGTVMVFWFLLRDIALRGGRLNSEQVLFAIIENLLPAGAMAAKIFLPFNLSGLAVAADTNYIYLIVAVLVLVFLFIFSKDKDWRYIIFGFLWFGIFLFPPFIVADAAPLLLEHRLYLPFFGLAIASFGFSELRSFSWQRHRHVYVALSIIIILALISFFHIAIFSDRIKFWESVAKSSPHSPLAQRNLGAMYYLDGDLNRAEVRFRQALQLNEQEAMAHNNLAAIYIDRGDLWRGETELKKELAINPNYDKALFNLGRIYYLREQYQAAGALWQRALKANSYNQEAALSLQELANKFQEKDSNFK